MAASHTHPRSTVHRMFELIEPVATVWLGDGPAAAFAERGMRSFWDGYFASRAAPFGAAPAEVVHAAFYNFADGEVARHIPWVWSRISPAEAVELRERASADALRAKLGPHAESPQVAEVADVLVRAAASAPIEGRSVFAGLRALAVPQEPVARLWHGANLLREHRGDSHNAVLLAHGIGGSEAHVMLALSWGMPAEKFGRLHHLPRAQVAGVVDGMRARGLVDPAGRFTDAGRALSERIEAVTDELAAHAYDGLTTDELDAVVAVLESFGLDDAGPSEG